MSIQKFISCTPLDLNGKKIDTPSELLGLNVLKTTGNYVIHRNLIKYMNSNKQGTASTKTRSETRGGGRKPWRQKGTGRARAGSSRSPLWKGGGVIFGPKPKKDHVKINKKERKLALQTLLYNKRASFLTLANLERDFVEPKTKAFLKILETCELDLNQKTLVVVSQKTVALKLAVQNLKKTELLLASNLNILSLLKAKQIILTGPAIKTIKETYCD